MASNRYIRIYCNGVKIRSTGAHKWYREMIIEQFGINDSKQSKSNNYYRENMKKFLISQIPLYRENEKVYKNGVNKFFKFKIEVVHKSNSGIKTVEETLKCPFYVYRPNNKGYFIYEDVFYL